jgi:hypothetical protein
VGQIAIAGVVIGECLPNGACAVDGKQRGVNHLAAKDSDEGFVEAYYAAALDAEAG